MSKDGSVTGDYQSLNIWITRPQTNKQGGEKGIVCVIYRKNFLNANPLIGIA